MATTPICNPNNCRVLFGTVAYFGVLWGAVGYYGGTVGVLWLLQGNGGTGRVRRLYLGVIGGTGYRVVLWGYCWLL